MKSERRKNNNKTVRAEIEDFKYRQKIKFGKKHLTEAEMKEVNGRKNRLERNTWQKQK